MLGEKYRKLYCEQLKKKVSGVLDLLTKITGIDGLLIYLSSHDDCLSKISSIKDSLPETIESKDISTVFLPYFYEIVCGVENKENLGEDIVAVIVYNRGKKGLSQDEIHRIEYVFRYIKCFIQNEVELFRQNIREHKNQINLIQLYRALNRQFTKERAISITLDFIRKKWRHETIYLDINEEQGMIIPQYFTKSNRLLGSPTVFRIKESVDHYKKMLLIDNSSEIQVYFPDLYNMCNPLALISGPVYSHNKLVGLLVVYYQKEDMDYKEFISMGKVLKAITGELTALFSRIERHNLSLEKMFGLTALENILLYNVDEDMNFDEILQRIVSIIPEATGMKRCTIALIDESEQYLLPHYSTIEPYEKARKRKYPLDKKLTKDHTAIIALETKKPVVVYDALTDPKCDPELARELGVFSNVTLPILDIHGESLGVMYIDNGEYGVFSKEQMRFFEIIARHLGLVISNISYIGDLKIKSKYDGLTGLFNRETFEDVYQKLYNSLRNDERKFSIMMLDIDNFKDTNDTYGHQLGDEILRRVAECIKDNLRKRDIVARYGGEEMIILLKDIEREEATTIAERILRSISNISVDGIKVTASIGIATYLTDSRDKNKLIKIADECLYEAKRAGKNQVKSRSN